MGNDLAMNGSFNEYSNPNLGKPIRHKGFMDWNLMLLAMMG